MRECIAIDKTAKSQLKAHMQSEFDEKRTKKDKAERGRIPFMVCNRARTQYFKVVFRQNGGMYCD
jgi:hypothetical protein